MGKKSATLESLETPELTVSIITITQLKRFPCIEILHDMIKDQTYKTIVEWVIVEGSRAAEDAAKNAENMRALIAKSDLPFPIRYIEWVAGSKLGALRNRGNTACTGDITVAMDDDDYYPVNRVSHVVESLGPSKCQIAGCSAMYIYDYTLERLYKFHGFGPNHGVNSTLAWKKSYLKNHQHDPEKETGEEPSFTNTFTEPMVQLDADKTCIQSGHGSNTYNKREILVGGTHKINPSLYEMSQPITNFIKEPYFSRMRAIFYKEEDSPYDIVYFAGGFSIQWEPTDKSLGGSEQAVVHLASCWASQGKKVAVYGVIPSAEKGVMRYKSVEYYDWKQFPFHHRHNIVILWRSYGLMSGGPFPIKAKHIWLDLHEGLIAKQFVESWFRYGSCVTKVFVKSQFHKEQFQRATHSKMPDSKYAVIPNGLRIEDFSVNRDSVPRNPFRFCYCSCYTRGLVPILQFVWPVIYSLEPRAELHVYYGMNGVRDENFKKMVYGLLSQPGVMDHGRQPVEMVAREKYMSSFHLYLSKAEGECDCISIRESLITGAIPLLSDYGVFKDRDGIHFQFDEKNPQAYANIGTKIVDLMRNVPLDAYRENFKKSDQIISWSDISKKWLAELPSANKVEDVYVAC